VERTATVAVASAIAAAMVGGSVLIGTNLGAVGTADGAVGTLPQGPAAPAVEVLVRTEPPVPPAAGLAAPAPAVPLPAPAPPLTEQPPPDLSGGHGAAGDDDAADAAEDAADDRADAAEDAADDAADAAEDREDRSGSGGGGGDDD
jgi:hypothetical protein